MSFQVVALPETEFQALYGLRDDELARRGVRAVTALSESAYPCRVSLRDANIGARMFLLNYEHQPANSPYRSTHAIYVQDGAANAAVAINTVPDVLRTRLLSIRAFDSDGMIVDADVVGGVRPHRCLSACCRTTGRRTCMCTMRSGGATRRVWNGWCNVR